MCHASGVTCHLSPVTCHMSPVTCCLSPVTCQQISFFSSFFYIKKKWTKWWSQSKEGLFSTEPTPTSFKKLAGPILSSRTVSNHPASPCWFFSLSLHIPYRACVFFLIVSDCTCLFPIIPCLGTITHIMFIKQFVCQLGYMHLSPGIFVEIFMCSLKCFHSLHKLCQNGDIQQ